MPRSIPLPTSQTPCTPSGSVPRSYNLYTLLLAAVAAATGVALPTGGSYYAVTFVFSNSGSGDAYLAWLADLPAQQQTIQVTVPADGTWSVALTAPDGTAIVAEYVAVGSADADTIGAGLRAALTTECAGHGITVSGATDTVILTAAVGATWTMGVVTDPGAGAHTSTVTGTETEARTNQVIAGSTTKANPYQFGFFDPGYLSSQYLRCLADSSVTVTIILEVP